MEQISLPIDRHLPVIIQQINPNSAAADPFILTSSPGSGKTTRLPVALLKAVQGTGSKRKIVVLVPKRIAAVSATQRICDENNWIIGESTGYEVRFENKTSAQTQLIFMTTGHFLKKILNDSFFNDVGWIIFDEFHERLLENDFLLGFCREQKILNSQLQIIVMSATLSVEPLKNYLQTSNIYHIDEQPFHLEIRYSAKSQFLECNDPFYDLLKLTTREALKATQANILIFLPGLKEINRALQWLQTDLPQRDFLVFHGQLSLDEQRAVINKLQNSQLDLKKYIVLSTNISETSLTLPHTDGVIDSGLERTAKIEKYFGFSNLMTQRISQFSAIQRAGRAARQKNGLCFRLWHKTDERSMREAVVPEVLTRPLDTIYLFHCGLLQCHPNQFEWLTPPKPADSNSAVQEILSKQLVTEKFHLSQMGEHILSIPLDLDSAFLFYFLTQEGFAELASDFFARLDDLPKKRIAVTLGEDDVDFIFNMSLSFTQKQKRQQLLGLAQKITQPMKPVRSSTADLRQSMVALHFKFLKNRLLANSGKFARSYKGRGAELDAHSAAQHEPFFMALQGFETETQSTQITYALGIKKTDFLKAAESEIVSEQLLEYDAQKESFFQKKIKRFGAMIVNEESKQAVSLHAIQEHWTSYLDQNFDVLMKDNVSYLSFIEKFRFIQKIVATHPELFTFASLDADDLAELKTLIRQHIKDFLSDFNSLKTFELMGSAEYLITNSDKLAAILKTIARLPSEFILTSGRACKIVYDDEKAPLISAKVQDFYGQKTHPKILGDRLEITCELLAPNYRPTQVTKNLPGFWKESYFEVRKELKGRYPRHDWPENPEDFKKIPKAK